MLVHIAVGSSLVFLSPTRTDERGYRDDIFTKIGIDKEADEEGDPIARRKRVSKR